MAMTSIGDLAQMHFLRRHTATTKASLDQLTVEVATGKATDPAAHLRGDSATVATLDAALARLKAYGTVTRDLSLKAEAQQRALAHVNDAAVKASGALVTAAHGTEQGITAAGQEARQALEISLSALNLRLGDHALFAGSDTGGTAILPVDAFMATVRATLGGVTGATAIRQAVSDWFASPDGFAAAYLGAASSPALPIADGQVAKLDVTAADPALRDTLKALTLGALLADPGFGATADRSALARHAGEALAGLATDRAALAGRLGATQDRLEQAAIRNQAEETALSIARNGLLTVDPYETATRLQETEARLETIYALTARLSRLSLLDHI